MDQDLGQSSAGWFFCSRQHQLCHSFNWARLESPRRPNWTAWHLMTSHLQVLSHQSPVCLISLQLTACFPKSVSRGEASTCQVNAWIVLLMARCPEPVTCPNPPVGEGYTRAWRPECVRFLGLHSLQCNRQPTYEGTPVLTLVLKDLTVQHSISK